MIRRVLGVATAALVLSLGVGQVGAHADQPCGEGTCIITFDNTPGYQYVSYEALPSTGVNVNEKYVLFSDDEDECAGDFTKVPPNSTMTITVKNSTFKNYGNVGLFAEALFVNKDDETDKVRKGVVIKPSQTASNRLDFKFSEGNVFDAATGDEVAFEFVDEGDPTDPNDDKTYVLQNFTIEKLTELDTDGHTAADNLWMQIPGTLQVGDRAQIVITTVDKEGNHLPNGCVRKDFIIVENQYTAKKPGIDEEGLAVIIENDKAGVLKVYDDEISDQPLDYALYNPCTPPACNGKGKVAPSECCEHLDGTCSLFCNKETVEEGGGETTTAEVCADPGYCNEKTSCVCSEAQIDGLRILQTKDMENAVVKVTSLADSNVTLTLTGDMRGVTKVEFVAPNYQTGNYDTLCSATPENGVASCSVNGRTLFQDFYKNPQTGSIDVSFKVYVDGKTQLAPQSFYASAEISGGQLYKAAKLDWGEVMTWGQGAKAPAFFKVPYVRSDSLIATAIRVENTGDDTPLILYVSDPNGGWKFIKAIAVGAGQEIIIKGTDIVNWAKDAGLDLMAEKQGRFAVLGITGMSPCESASCTTGCKLNLGAHAPEEFIQGSCPAIEGAIDKFKNLNIYVAQQVIGTTNVRFVPVELIPGTPDNLHF